jgi:protoporphyrinogen/coproporphyrinogen III oxidase
MKRIAILGGGISGLVAAYELELARRRGAQIDWQLYEASDRLGGIIETTRHKTPEGEWVLEGGPDGWISEKPWARELAVELGLEHELIYSNDATRKTYILIDGQLQAMPDRMRMMVPEDLSALDGSALFSTSAKQAYAAEITRAEELKASAPQQDESVASFVRRHFGDEVLEKVGAPMLSGVFGGDVAKLSVHAVMPAFVAMEREHGSLILAIQSKAKTRKDRAPLPIFTSLRRGMALLIEALVLTLPADRIHLLTRAEDFSVPSNEGGFVRTISTMHPEREPVVRFADHILCALPLDATRKLIEPHVGRLASLFPEEASSAVLVTFCWDVETAETFDIPAGFGFLAPQRTFSSEQKFLPQLLAATFTHQKFPHRTPNGARAIRAFFGTDSAEQFANTPDERVVATALEQLSQVLGEIPAAEPGFTSVRRWPRSLPQYEVGHLERVAALEDGVTKLGGITLLGNSYRGVGLPDLIHAARLSAQALL